MKILFGNAATWVVAIVLAALSFMWTQSGRIAALEANQNSYQNQLNRIENKVDYIIEHGGFK